MLFLLIGGVLALLNRFRAEQRVTTHLAREGWTVDDPGGRELFTVRSDGDPLTPDEIDDAIARTLRIAGLLGLPGAPAPGPS